MIRYFLLLLLVGWPHMGVYAADGKSSESDTISSSAAPESLEYMKLESKLNTLHGRVAELEKQFSEMSRAIEQTNDTEERSRLAKELIDIAKQRNQAAKEYMDVREDTRYRFPSKGEALDRKYLSMKPKSTEDLKQTDTLDNTLTELKQQVDRKYAPLKPKPEASPGVESAHSIPVGPKVDAKKPKKKLRLVK